MLSLEYTRALPIAHSVKRSFVAYWFQFLQYVLFARGYIQALQTLCNLKSVVAKKENDLSEQLSSRSRRYIPRKAAIQSKTDMGGWRMHKQIGQHKWFIEHKLQFDTVIIIIINIYTYIVFF